MGPVMNKVVRPDVIAVLGSQADKRAIGKVEARSFGLFLRDFQAFLTPNCVDDTFSHLKAFTNQQVGNSAIAVTPVLSR